MIIKITKKTAGARLDKFLAETEPVLGKIRLSRSQIQKLIEKNLIMINGAPASSHYRLKPGDLINFQKKPVEAGSPAQAELKTAPDFKAEIIAENDEFLIINKPAGLAVEARSGYALTDWLKAEHPEIKDAGEDPNRPGLVHRLDREVSGLMVIAKTRASFANLKKQFQNRTIVKEYTALVHGKIQKDEDLINFPIKRSRDGYKMAAMPRTVKGEPELTGRLAETEFRIIARLINYTLLKVKIKTGRTHQIRVHLAAYGHPLAGDKIYGTAKTKKQNQRLNLNRVFLVADRLSFADLAGERKDFKIGLTEELKNLLEQIK